MRYIILVLILPLILAGCIRTSTNNNPELSNDNVPNGQIVEENGEETNTYNMAEINQHASAEDCWLLIDGKVYDVTDFIASGKHGGGEAILEGCGIDSTQLYKTRPMGSGTDHSEKAYGFLENFYIGDFKE